MKPEEQRTAIAEACGWQGPFQHHHFGQLLGSRNLGHGIEQLVPDYLNDLNAMHEAEKILTPEQGWEYAQNLAVDGGKGWFATASERAKAFLRTLNLWKDE